MVTTRFTRSSTFQGTILQGCMDAWVRSGYSGKYGNANASRLLVSELLAEPRHPTEVPIFLPLEDHSVAGAITTVAAAMEDANKHGDSYCGSVISEALRFAFVMQEKAASFERTSLWQKGDDVITFYDGSIESTANAIWELYRLQWLRIGNKGQTLTVVCHSPIKDIEATVARLDTFFDGSTLQSYVGALIGERYDTIEWRTQETKEVEAALPTPIPLVWTEPMPPSEECRYARVIAKSVFGDIVIEWKDWKENDSYDAQLPFANEEWNIPEHISRWSLDDAKALVEVFYVYAMRKAMGYDVQWPIV